MPQPLSKVHPSPTVHFDDSAADRLPVLASQVAKIITNWALLDAIVGNIFAQILHAESQAGAAIYGVMTSGNVQDKAMDAAAKHKLSEDDFDLLRSVRAFSEKARTQRNDIAHGVWGYADEIPDGLLLMPPREATRFVERSEWYTRQVAATLLRKHGEPPPEPTLDHSQIGVYKMADFVRARDDIKAARKNWLDLRFACLPTIRHGMLPIETPEGARLRLLGQPEILSKVNNIRKGRGAPPLPPP